jgi:ABC-type bacteriocin/lantibiotic exporter with double-glycine peptidase domain
VPVLLQLKATECGTACLAMVLSYYGRETSVAECREICDTGRDGLSARTIAEAARSCGLRVKAFSLEPADLKYVRLPAVAHWGFDHFVVVEKWSPRRVVIVDPAAGRRRLRREEFEADFTGVVLTFEPGAHFRTRRREGSFWLEYLKSMLAAPGNKRVLAQILLASALLQAAGLALPVFTKVLVDQVLPFRIGNVLTLLGVGVTCVVAVQALMSYLRSSMLIYLRGLLDSKLMLDFFEHLLALPFRYFQERTSGDLLMRMGSNSLIREVFTDQTLSIFLDGSLVILYGAILLTQAPLFGLAALTLGALQLLILLSTRVRVRHLLQRELNAESEERSYVVEVLKGMPVLKASGAENRALDHWSNLFFRRLNASLERDRSLAVIESGVGALRMFSPLLLLWLGATLVLDGRMSLGTMLALNALGTAFLAPLSALVASGQQLQLAGAHLERLSDVLTAEPEQAVRPGTGAPPLAGRIEARNLRFRYGPDSPEVVSGVSFTVEPGQKVALVGPTGCGKSTLVMLLLGLYQPTGGEVFYDGRSLREHNYLRLRGQVGVVLQESFIFSGSVRQNIALHDPGASLEEVERVSELACIDADVSRMPMGYETPVAEGGTALSGGQRQRLSIARALLRDPRILMLDEATSHLDAVTERRLDEHLSSLSCTRVVVAHRLSTISNADLILVMDRGCIVERGRHHELLRMGGLYAELVGGQSRAEADEPPSA